MDVRPPAPGLRERKKVKTRDDLSRAALALFRSKGYDETTVDEIAASIDVSKRTFFRYFDSKEEVLMSYVREAADLLVAELARRPAAETPLEAMRVSGASALEHLNQVLPLYEGVPLYNVVLQIIESTPALAASNLRLLMEREQTIVDLLGRREGVDPRCDPRPRLLAAVYSITVLVSNRAWTESGSTETRSMLDMLDTHLDSLVSALDGHWSH